MIAPRAVAWPVALLLAVAAGTASGGEKPGDKAGVRFSDLPLNLAIKQVRGNGRRMFAIFEDPNCGYCKQLATDTVGLTDVTIYSFVYPILGSDSVAKAKAIFCAPDPATAWNDWMLNGTRPAAANCDAGAVDRLVAIGKRLGIRGTPTIFLADGERLSGAVSRMTLEMAISSPKVLAAQAEAANRSP